MISHILFGSVHFFVCASIPKHTNTEFWCCLANNFGFQYCFSHRTITWYGYCYRCCVIAWMLQAFKWCAKIFQPIYMEFMWERKLTEYILNIVIGFCVHVQTMYTDSFDIMASSFTSIPSIASYIYTRTRYAIDTIDSLTNSIVGHRHYWLLLLFFFSFERDNLLSVDWSFFFISEMKNRSFSLKLKMNIFFCCS